MNKEMQLKIEIYFKDDIQYKSDIHRNILIQLRGNKCQHCGIEKWNNEHLAMECHHIDGNKRNNKIENLILLCPNCHSQTQNYKGRKRGKSEYITDEVIINMIPNCTSINDLLNKLHLAGGGNYIRIKNIITEHNLHFNQNVILKNQKEVKRHIYNCSKCGEKLYKKGKTGLCKNCLHQKRLQEANIPSKQQLLKDYKELGSMLAIGRKYNRTDNAIKRWFVKYNIDYHKENIQKLISK